MCVKRDAALSLLSKAVKSGSSVPFHLHSRWHTSFVVYSVTKIMAMTPSCQSPNHAENLSTITYLVCKFQTIPDLSTLDARVRTNGSLMNGTHSFASC